MQDMASLQGKRIVIAGGTKGIGLAAAKLLASFGARLFVFSRHDDNLEIALEQIGNDAIGGVADQSNPADVARIFKEADEVLSGLDMLVNDAAAAAGSIVDTEFGKWHYVVQANLVGYMLNCAEAIPLLKKAGGGRILNVGSMSAKICEEGSDVYVATKAGIRGFSDSLGKTLADAQIAVTLIEPGLIATDLTESSPSEMSDRLAKQEMLTPEDVARSIAFVLSQPVHCSIPLLQVRPLCQKI